MNIRGRICVRLIEDLIINNKKTKMLYIDETLKQNNLNNKYLQKRRVYMGMKMSLLSLKFR